MIVGQGYAVRIFEGWGFCGWVLLWFYGLLVDDVYEVVFVDLCLEGSNFSDNKLSEKNTSSAQH